MSEVTKILILICMIFCHIVDDYYLQGWLASAKQRQWWKDNAPDKLYEYDYKMALFMHSFSWAFMSMIIPTIYSLITETENWYVFLLFVVNLAIHAIVDDLKANKRKINLIQDQSIHILQIICTWFLIVII